MALAVGAVVLGDLVAGHSADAGADDRAAGLAAAVRHRVAEQAAGQGADDRAADLAIVGALLAIAAGLRRDGRSPPCPRLRATRTRAAKA